MFRCPKTGGAFDSGFRFAPQELASVETEYKLNIRCRSCLGLHEFRLAAAWIEVRRWCEPRRAFSLRPARQRCAAISPEPDLTPRVT